MAEIGVTPLVGTVLMGVDATGKTKILTLDTSGGMTASATNVDTAALVTLTAAAVGANSADQTNGTGRGINLVVDITAITGTTPTLTVTLQGKDAASGKYYTILASAALSAVATTVLTVFPGATAAANVAANAQLPRTWRVITVIAGTTPAVTATVGASVIG